MVLTNDDFETVRRLAQRAGVPKNEYINAGLSKANWKAMIQGIEDRYEANEATEKAAMDADAGTTLTNPMAKKTQQAWQGWRFPQA